MNLNNLPDVEFAQKDIETILADTIAGYEQAYFEQTGEKKKLYPGDPIRIFLYSQALREYQLRQLINYSAKQNLLKYAEKAYLDHKGADSNTERLSASKAKTTVKFILSAAQPTIKTIPAETRMSPGDNVFFENTESIDIASGLTEIDVVMECTEAGIKGNGFTQGQINILVDPLPWIASASNTDTSTGGADVEDDDSYRERIWLAPESFSVAGPSGAYEFFAKEYSSSILDVKLSSPSAGTVDVRILLEDGEIPSAAFLQGVDDYLSGKTRRPLTDNVSVAAPEVVTYNVDLTYYISSNDANEVDTIKSNVDKAVEDYNLWQKSKIGRDVNPSELIAKVMGASAKRVTVTYPTYTAITETQVANVDTVSVTYGGLEDD